LYACKASKSALWQVRFGKVQRYGALLAAKRSGKKCSVKVQQSAVKMYGGSIRRFAGTS
jgi:hypothetical protein